VVAIITRAGEDGLFLVIFGMTEVHQLPPRMLIQHKKMRPAEMQYSPGIVKVDMLLDAKFIVAPSVTQKATRIQGWSLLTFQTRPARVVA